MFFLPGKSTETVELLTKRETEILDFLAKGYLYTEIATELFISKETVKKHIHNIYDKLHVQTRTEALNKAFPTWHFSIFLFLPF